MILPCWTVSGGGAGGAAGEAFGAGAGAASLAAASAISRNAAMVLGPAPRCCKSSRVRSSSRSVSFMRCRVLATSASFCFNWTAELMNWVRSRMVMDWANANVAARQRRTHAWRGFNMGSFYDGSMARGWGLLVALVAGCWWLAAGAWLLVAGDW